MDNYLALLDFFNKFPQLKTNPFFVTGESYGGVYVPTLSSRILKGNSTINMKVSFFIACFHWCFIIVNTRLNSIVIIS